MQWWRQTLLALTSCQEKEGGAVCVVQCRAMVSAHQQYMAEHGGVIVNIIADMFRGFPMMAHTGAARAGVENLARSLAVEWASDGVRINSVAPGSSIYSPTASANYAKDFSPFEMARPGVPAKRLGSTLEVSWKFHFKHFMNCSEQYSSFL